MKGWKELEYEVVRDAADVCHIWMSAQISTFHESSEHNNLLQHGKL
jgi:carbamoylphosphate synthase large subunit